MYRKKLLIWFSTILVWLAIFGAHAYYHVKSLTGQCCGYEGEPGFLLLFFLMWPGLLYFIGLVIILIAGLIIFWWPLPKE